MRTLASYLPAILCGAMMLLVCIPMMRNMHKGHGESGETDAREEIAELREEIARFKAERAPQNESETVDG